MGAGCGQRRMNLAVRISVHLARRVVAPERWRRLGERDFVVMDQHHVTHRKLRFGVRDTMSRHANVGEGPAVLWGPAADFGCVS